MLFRLKEGYGQHTELDNTVYRSGDEFESDSDLCKAFPDKFERLNLTSKVKPKAKPDIPAPDRVRKTPDPVPADWDSDAYTDVTEDFEDADVAELKVYRQGTTKFFVVDPDDSKKVHTKKSLKKQEVNGVLSEFVVNDDEEDDDEDE